MSDEELIPPLDFKVFEPCKTNRHHECAEQTAKTKCICVCHEGEYDDDWSQEDTGTELEAEEDMEA